MTKPSLTCATGIPRESCAHPGPEEGAAGALRRACLLLVAGISDPGIFTVLQRKPRPLRPQGHDLQWHLASFCPVPGIALVDHGGSTGSRGCSCSTQGSLAHPPCPALLLWLLRLACGGTLLSTASHSVWPHDPSRHSLRDPMSGQLKGCADVTVALG